MSPAAIEIALSPFGQVANVHTRAHDGSGPRLTLVKSLATLHGPAFSIESSQATAPGCACSPRTLGRDCADAIPPQLIAAD